MIEYLKANARDLILIVLVSAFVGRVALEILGYGRRD